MISTKEITNIEQYYFKENNKEPFPIQRIRWLEKIMPYTKTTFSNLKQFLSDSSNDYLNNLTTMELTHDTLYDIAEADTSESIYKHITDNGWEDLIHPTVYNLTFMYNWNIYKQVYRFDNDILNLLFNSTDIDKIPIDIINNNLPYPAFFIDNKITSKYSDITFRGCFVTLLNICGRTDLGLFFIEDNIGSDYHYCFVPLYFGNITIREAMKKRDELYNVNSEDEEAELTIDLANHILKAIVYICSVNKEVETIKVTVDSTANKTKSNNKKKKKPTIINQNLVGYKMGNTIRQNKKSYIYVDEEGNTVSKKKGTGTKKSPHMRMAHYHHFWTGPLNNPDSRKLILKFIPPLYINSNKEAIKTATLHRVK